jgi:hypothetical protein
MKKVASALGVTLSEAYELLAYSTARRNAASRREMALGARRPSKSSLTIEPIKGPFETSGGRYLDRTRIAQRTLSAVRKRGTGDEGEG